MFRPTWKPTRTFEPMQLVDHLTDLLRRCLPLELKPTRLTPEEVWGVLAYASVRQQTIEGACRVLEGAPSGNRLREVLAVALPPLPQLQRQLNTLLRRQLPRSLWKKQRPFHLALDLTLIPYHGQPQADPAELLRANSRSGTTHFHGYATAAIVHHRRRYTLAVYWVRGGYTMAEVARRLLDRVKRLQLPVKRVYADAGFCSVGVLRLLRRRKLPYLLPLPVRGRTGGVRNLLQGRKSYWTTYTLNSSRGSRITVPVVVVQRYLKDRFGHRGRKWFAFVVAGLPPSTTPAQVFEWYRRRFAIETGYRQMHQLRARTASRRPALRFVLVGLAFLLLNLYFSVRHALGLHPPDPAPPRRITLTELGLALARTLEALHGLVPIGLLQPIYAVS